MKQPAAVSRRVTRVARAAASRAIAEAVDKAAQGSRVRSPWRGGTATCSRTCAEAGAVLHVLWLDSC